MSREDTTRPIRIVEAVTGSSAPPTTFVDPSVSALAAPSPSLRVLVARGNHLFRLVLRRMLVELGHEVEQVPEAHTAVERAGEGWDVLFMDLLMPDMDCATATRLIRRRYGPDLPIVAITDHILTPELSQSELTGMHAIIPSPLCITDVRRALSPHSLRTRPQPARLASAG